MQMMECDNISWDSKRVALKLDMDLTVEAVLHSLGTQCNDASVAQHRLLLVVWSGHGEAGTGDWVCSDGAVTYASVWIELFGYRNLAVTETRNRTSPGTSIHRRVCI